MSTIDDLVADLNGTGTREPLHYRTHVGLRRYERLVFGINAASEIFQKAIKEILTGLSGCKNISDGKTQKKHDENLRGVLERLQ